MDVIMTLRSLRGVVDMSATTSPAAVQRYLDLLVAGLRPGAARLVHPPVTGFWPDMNAAWAPAVTASASCGPAPGGTGARP